MFFYEKKLQFPVKIATPNPKLAAFIITQYGGPDGEVGAAMRYLSQRYAMPFAEAKGALTDIGTMDAPCTSSPPAPAFPYPLKIHRAESRHSRTSTLPSGQTVIWSNMRPKKRSFSASPRTISKTAAQISSSVGIPDPPSVCPAADCSRSNCFNFRSQLPLRNRASASLSFPSR